jgi:hypothetical protein
MAKMTDTDMIQVWTGTETMHASEISGRADIKVTETLDWTTRLITRTVTGVSDGESIRETSTSEIHDCATPRAAALYRSRNGYVRTK